MRVGQGTWSGPGNRDIDLEGKDIAVIGEAGPSVTVIDCGYAGRGFVAHGQETRAARIEGLTILHGFAGEGWDVGGGIAVFYPANLTIRDCVIGQCSSSAGGGIYLSGNDSVIDRCVIEGNTCQSEGGGSSGGGIASNGWVTVLDSRIESNDAAPGVSVDYPGCGGGFGGAGHLTRCVISGNSADAGGGVWGSGTLEDCVITGNHANEQGGGVYADELSIIGCTIACNRMSGDGVDAIGGGGLLCSGNTQLDRTILWGNCTSLTGSQALVVWGALYLNCSDTDPAGIVGQVHYVGGNIFAPPVFCAPLTCLDAPATGGDYTVRLDSPCLPDQSPCGQRIGALDAGCDAPASVETSGIGRANLLAAPNPFTSRISLTISIPERASGLRIYGVDGRRVRDLAGPIGPGSFTLVWDGKDDLGRPVPAGIYLAGIGTSSGITVVRRLERIR